MRGKIFGSFAVVLALAAFTATARADQWSKTFSVTAKPHLALEADNAALRISTGPSGQVSVRVTTVEWTIPRDVRIVETQNGNDIRVQVKQVSHWFSFSHGSATVQITVPATADLDLSTGNGDVTLGAVSGAVRVSTANGRVTAHAPRGSVSLRTGNGRIEAQGVVGSLAARTSNGRISVSGRLDALQVRTGRGQIDATILPGSKPSSDWSLQAGVGNVILSLPPGFSADVNGSTGMGHVSVDFPVTVSGSIAGSSFRGRLGKGGTKLRLHTGVGDVRIQRAAP